jgi:hypothetical protein
MVSGRLLADWLSLSPHTFATYASSLLLLLSFLPSRVQAREIGRQRKTARFFSLFSSPSNKKKPSSACRFSHSGPESNRRRALLLYFFLFFLFFSFLLSLVCFQDTFFFRSPSWYL